MRVTQRIVVGTLFLALLEYLIGIVWDFTHLVLHAPSAEPCLVAVITIGFQSPIQVHDVILGKDIVVGRSGTEVESKHTVVGAFHDTAIRHNRHRQGR